ncbi:testis-expressed sequence 2 protein-like isoform X1 [Poecilia formosa]|uniref:Testis expressed 2 n=1 Tax=Poecilia formosa TaxID=48698 RepID=A0A087YED2_POEFO|nr:PREDICTED: testis-expressed sequence 2 protein-like isoform X1 [Poecilia formosa]XP_007544835.1 PREDICTED: testis-expressed sequence 2 protein-like isoform X1 [Poecilia formosa]XP_007544843.1 PREDICTED: testis-expressed sequence 2 protein-like isoform X1 [Poecilia formosa]
MTSQYPSHGAKSTDKKPSVVAPKLHVQRSPSKEAITIHFSALGKEDEEEEEGLFISACPTASAPLDDSNIVTALEASEEMFDGASLDSAASGAVIPEYSKFSPSSTNHTNRSPTQTLSSHVPEQKASSASSSPIKSLSFPSTLGWGKSSSSDIESGEGPSSALTSSVRHRQLMKNLVKSLSSDTSQDSSSSSTSYRLPDSRLNLNLLKQFAQSRMPSVAVASVNDSKTAPSSPLTSPDNRSFFKVSDVEARFGDTKRRLTEAISEPLQLLSKIMDEKSGGGIYRPKGLSASATELSTISSVCRNQESISNNNYSIKEEDGVDVQAESPNSWTSVGAESPGEPSADTKSPNKLSLLSLSALAKQEEEDFCILNNEDFETCTDTEGDGKEGATTTQADSQLPQSGSLDPNIDDKCEKCEQAPNVPYHILALLILLVYGCFVLPIPGYIRGMLIGMVVGFFLALGVVWLTGPKSREHEKRHSRKLSKITRLDVKEPETYKGWMNEISIYDPETYHATLTQSVFVRLEGSVIRLSKPNHNISRRAGHSEPKPDVSFVSQKIYDLRNSKVYLLPLNLAKKRVWNKKYPICIELGRQDDFMSKIDEADEDRSEDGETSSAGINQEGTSEAQDQRFSLSKRDLTIFLFGRTGREKEDWFQRFLSASNVRVNMKKVPSVGISTKPTASSCQSSGSSRTSIDEAMAPLFKSRDSISSLTLPGSFRSKQFLEYSVYMASLLQKHQADNLTSAGSAQSPQSSPGADKKVQSNTSAQEQLKGQEEDSVAWVNATLGRLFWDFLTEPYWCEQVSKKIQMKLSKIRLPYFMNELTLTELDMGTSTPRILGASAPSVDCRGLWFDLEISYTGSFLMTLETKMILNRLGKEEESLRLGELGKDGHRPRTYCLSASDEESSSAGSSDEEDNTDIANDPAGSESPVGGRRPSKIIRIVDKIAKSKYFQKATETEFIKKKLEEVSNTPLLLTVEVQQLRGTLAVNIPPPPTDRIWYGFRIPPHLELKARPKLGEREVTLYHVTDWIEKKLYQEFQKILVMPNMDDVWLTLMHSAMDHRTAGGPLVSFPGIEEMS